MCLLFAGLLLFGAAAPVWAEDTRSLTAQITAIQKQIDAQAKHLDALKAQISDKNAELAKQKQAFSRARRGMSERVRAFYMFGNDGILQYLFTSDSIPEFLTKADQMRTVMSADNAQVAKVERLQRQIAREKAALEQEQRKAEQSQKQLNARLKTMQQKLMAYEKEHPDTSDNNRHLLSRAWIFGETYSGSITCQPPADKTYVKHFMTYILTKRFLLLTLANVKAGTPFDSFINSSIGKRRSII